MLDWYFDVSSSFGQQAHPMLRTRAMNGVLVYTMIFTNESDFFYHKTIGTVCEPHYLLLVESGQLSFVIKYV